MSSVPMPRDLSEEAVAEWMVDVYYGPGAISPGTVNKARGALEMQRSLARAVRALVSAKVREAVREAVDLARHSPYSNTRSIVDHVVSRVLGDHPSRSESASDEAPRG